MWILGLKGLKAFQSEEHLSFVFVLFFSGGNRRKLSTAIALVGNPPIIFLVSTVAR